MYCTPRCLGLAFVIERFGCYLLSFRRGSSAEVFKADKFAVMDDTQMSRPDEVARFLWRAPRRTTRARRATSPGNWPWPFWRWASAARTIRSPAFPLWEDEAFLCANFINRDFRGLLAPLDFQQVGPILFLWLELAVTRVLGYTELTLRLVPFLASIGSLLLFYRLRPHLSQRPASPGCNRAIFRDVWNDPLQCRGEALRRRSVRVAGAQHLRGQLAGKAVVPSLALDAGGVHSAASGAFLWRGIRRGRPLPDPGRGDLAAATWDSVLPWSMFTAALLGSFLVVYLVNVRTQSAAVLGVMREYWAAEFPPRDSVMALLKWLVSTHASDMISYPAGGLHFQSSLSMLAWLAGLAALARRAPMG